MAQPTDNDLIARALAAWWLAAPATTLDDNGPSARASTLEENGGLRYVVLRSVAADGTEDVLAVYRIVPANSTTPTRLRLMKRPPAALAS